MKWLMIGFIKAWRAVVSPWYGNVCKYYPTCSAYGLEAIQVHGAIKGAGLTMWRIVRCNPWSHGGYDPVPGTAAADRWQAEQAEEARLAQIIHRDAAQDRVAEDGEARVIDDHRRAHEHAACGASSPSARRHPGFVRVGVGSVATAEGMTR